MMSLRRSPELSLSASHMWYSVYLQAHSSLMPQSTSHPEVFFQLSRGSGKDHRSIYVDDIISGAYTDDHAYGLYSDSKMVFKEGGFNLRKFVTNSSDLQKTIVGNERLIQLPPTDHTLNDEESYAKLTLGTTEKVPT